jgi:hypothetical protein
MLIAGIYQNLSFKFWPLGALIMKDLDHRVEWHRERTIIALLTPEMSTLAKRRWELFELRSEIIKPWRWHLPHVDVRASWPLWMSPILPDPKDDPSATSTDSNFKKRIQIAL